MAAGSGLIGLGVGASVSPALFITGFSLRSAQIQRVFALLELLRGITAFLVAPILLYLATVIGPSATAGTQTAIWICLAIAVGGVLVTLAVFVLGGGRLQAPDLETWQDDGRAAAWESPPLLARLRDSKSPEAVEHGLHVRSESRLYPERTLALPGAAAGSLRPADLDAASSTR